MRKMIAVRQLFESDEVGTGDTCHHVLVVMAVGPQLDSAND